MIRRKIKNVVKNFTEIEILVREATSNESWGPSNSILVKIAVLSSTDANIIQIMPIIWKRLKDTGKKWRHVYKSLILMEFLITRGNPAIADNCRQNIHFLQTLEQFIYEDNNVDVGNRIRKRAETLVRLLKDNDLLRSERNKAAITDLRFSKAIISQGSNVPIKYGNGVGSLSQGPSTGSFGSNTDNNKDYIKSEYVVPANLLEEDMQLQIALAESQEDADKRKQLDEIEELTDKYKLSLAVDKNLKENEFKDSFELESSKLDIWEAENESDKCPNDPWSPVTGDHKSTDFPPANNPWSSIEASNDSLWSNSLRPDPLDPWSPSQPRKDTSCAADDVAWPPLSSASIDCLDPWRGDSKSPNKIMTTSVSQSAIDGSQQQHNPWANVASSNPIPRKFPGAAKNDNAVTNFLANHSYLVDFDNLIVATECPRPPPPLPPMSLPPAARTGYNPFYEQPYPSSLLSPERPARVDWSNFETGSPIATSTESRGPFVQSSLNFNPFLT